MIKQRQNLFLPSRWYYNVTLALEEIADYLTEEEYRRWIDTCPEVNFDLHFDFEPADKDSGLPFDTLDWNGEWSLPRVGNYPDKIKGAITDYLDSIDVNARWAEEAYQSYVDYCDYLRFGDI